MTFSFLSQTFETLGKALKLVFAPDGGLVTPLQCQMAAKDLVEAFRKQDAPFPSEVNKVIASLKNEQGNQILAELLETNVL